MKYLLSVFITSLLIFTSMALAETIQPPLDEMMANSSGKIGVIVALADKVDNAALDQQLRSRQVTLAERHYEVVTTLRNKATDTQSEILSHLDRLQIENKVEHVRNFWIANMVSFKGTPEAIREIADLPGVEKVYFDFPVETIAPIIDPNYKPPVITSHPDGLEVMHVPEVWAMGYTGAGRLVSNIDTGVDGTHPALSARWRGNNGHPAADCWFDPVDGYSTPTDHGQHGTHTMGTICGRSTTTYDTVGVAINAQWIAAGSVDYGGTTSDIIASFQFIADPDGNPNTTDDVPDAVGNSWGYSPILHGVPHCDPTFWAAIDGCENAGVVVIFSAGNEGSYGSNSLRTPADRASTYFNAFSVGAIDGHTPGYPIADFSSLGPCSCASGDMAIKPECVAPGVNVYSSIPGGGYAGNWSGTSMASPHITGSVAILRQVNPNLDVNTIKDIILQSCGNLGPSGEDNTYGHGFVDLRLAVQLAMNGFGAVEGFVRDATTNNPLQASVSVVNGSQTVTANTLGHYILALPADTTYTIRASYFGYYPVEHVVSVAANDTASQDYLLSPAPSAVLQGYVISTNGDSIANASITILGTPLAPVTTNSHGFYMFPAVPIGTICETQAEALGYGTVIDTIQIQSGTNNLDFYLYPAEPFEINNGQYIGSGVWEWGAPTAGPTGAHSGSNVWGTVLNGEYPDLADDPLYSRDYTIIQNNALLEFYQWYSTEATWDGGNVSISTDGGATWSLLTPGGGYPDASVYALGGPGYDGSSSGWQLAHFDLTGYNGQTVRFRFRFASDGSVTSTGWYIDDVTVIGAEIPIPPNMTYDPSSFIKSAPIGGIVLDTLSIGNISGGVLTFSVTEITDPLRLSFGDQVGRGKISQTPPEPIGYSDIKGAKLDDQHQPIFPPVELARGGPDAFGHFWVDSDDPDGPDYNWVDISSVGTLIQFVGDDDYAGPINMGMNFSFFGTNYSSIYITANGLLCFGSGSSSYSNVGIPNSSAPNNFIAMLWDDLSPQRHGTVYYYHDVPNDRFIVSFSNIEFYTGGGDLYFEAILYPNGSFSLEYGTINGGTRGLNSLTIGLENNTGNDGLQVAYNANYLHGNMAIYSNIPGNWMTLSLHGGSLVAGDDTSAVVTFDAAELSAGTYTGHIALDSNDPDQYSINIPVSFTVGSTGTPDILQTPSSLSDTLYENGTSTLVLKAKNIGNATLIASFSDSASWLNETLGPFNIVPGDSVLEAINFNAGGLVPGTYQSAVVTTSNDPDAPTIRTSVTLLVLALPHPDINLIGATFTDTVYTGGIASRAFYIANVGSDLLYYGLHDNRAWIAVAPDTGNVPIGQRDTIIVSLDASTLTPGEYSGQITLNSNDPDEGLFTLPVDLLVTEMGGCNYVIGDVNDGGSFNGLDVTYGVAFFKGGPEPPFACDCPPHGTWFVSGDVNSSCSFNGLDITYMVAYFKGGPAPSPCPDCAPVILLKQKGNSSQGARY